MSLENAMWELRDAVAQLEARRAEAATPARKADRIAWPVVCQKLGYSEAEIRAIRRHLMWPDTCALDVHCDIAARAANLQTKNGALEGQILGLQQALSGRELHESVQPRFFVAVAAAAFGAWLHSRTVSREHAHVKRPLS